MGDGSKCNSPHAHTLSFTITIGLGVSVNVAKEGEKPAITIKIMEITMKCM